jgi:predicted dehydrogenase
LALAPGNGHDDPVTTGNLRWGIAATGSIAAAFVDALRQTEGADLVAVCSRTAERAEVFARTHGIPRHHGSYEALAEDPDVDVVYVATPHAQHFDAALLCIEAGKAVLVEKPITLDLASAARLVQAAHANNVFLMEAMWMRLNPAVRKIQELVEEGVIGWVSAIHADFGLQGPFPAEHRLRNPRLGGGALLDLGVYPIHLAHLIMGSPTAVRSWAHLTPEGVDENTGVLLGWEPGAVAALTCSINGESRNAASITGTDGRIDIPPGFFVPREFTLTRSGKAPETYQFPFDGNGYQFEAAEVQRCLLAGELESPLMPHATTLEIMGLLDTIREEIGVTY